MLDERIERAVREVARAPSTDESAVTAALRAKVTRRHARRRAFTGLAVTTMLVLGLVGAAVVVVDRDGGDDVRVATDELAPTGGQPDNPEAARRAITQTLADTTIPGLDPIAIRFVSRAQAVVTTSGYSGVRVRLEEDRWQLHPTSLCRIAQLIGTDPSCFRREPEVFRVPAEAANDRAYSGRAAAVDRIDLDGQDYVRGPFVAVGSNVWAGTYERDGATYTFPPSRLVAFDPEIEEVTAEVDLQGEIESRDEGERASWVVTHERNIDADRVEYRLKQIDGAGGVTSNPIPPGEVPVGRVVAGAGAVWVPVRDGVLVFDPGSGELQHKIPLLSQERRAVAVIGDRAYVTAVAAILEIDASSTTPGLPIAVPGTPAVLVDMVPAGDSLWLLDVGGEVVRLDAASHTIRLQFALPRPVGPGATLDSAGDRAWVQTPVDLTPALDPSLVSIGMEEALFLLDDHGVAQTVVISGFTDGAATFTADGTLVLTSGGDVYRARLPT